ncbi:hypothetical protein ABFV05_016039 [Capra hircus]
MGGARIKPTPFRLLSPPPNPEVLGLGYELPGSPGSAQLVQGLVESLGNALWQDLKEGTGRGLRLAAPPPSPVRRQADPPASSFSGLWIREEVAELQGRVLRTEVGRGRQENPIRTSCSWWTCTRNRLTRKRPITAASSSRLQTREGLGKRCEDDRTKLQVFSSQEWPLRGFRLFSKLIC